MSQDTPAVVTRTVTAAVSPELHTQLRIYAFETNQSVQKITGKIIADWAAANLK